MTTEVREDTETYEVASHVADGIVIMSPSEAQRITSQIRESLNNTGGLLAEAQDRQAWRALNYASWTAYLDGAFPESRRHLLRLLQIERVQRQLPVETPPLTSRDVTHVAHLMSGGAEPSDAYAQAIAEQEAARTSRGMQSDSQAFSRGGAAPKPSSHAHGYQTQADTVRKWAESVNAWAENYSRDDGLAPDFEGALKSLRAAIERFI